MGNLYTVGYLLLRGNGCQR